MSRQERAIRREIRAKKVVELTTELQDDIKGISKVIEQSSNAAVAFGVAILDRLGMFSEAQSLQKANASAVGETYDVLIKKAPSDAEKKRLTKLKEENSWPLESWLNQYTGAKKYAGRVSEKLHDNRALTLKFIDTLLRALDAQKTQEAWVELR